MNDLLNRIFGLNDIGFGSPDTVFTFLRAPGLWAWVLAIIGIGALSWWSYRGLAGSRLTRSSLAGVRTLLVLLVLLLAAGPMLERVTMHTEQDTVLVLLDRSGSLETPDADGQSRDAQLRAMLDGSSEEWGSLAESKRIVYASFNDRTTTLATQTIPEDPGPLGGRGSNIAGAIRAALDANTAAPIAGVVLVSDGRSTDTINPELINELASQRTAVYSVPLGSENPVRDLGITRIQTPDLVFADDRVPVRIDLQWTGIDQNLDHPVTLDLIDHATGQTIRSIEVNPDDFDESGTHQYTILHELSKPGETRLDIAIRADGPGDLNSDNNTGSATVRVADRPLRVLYIDGYPRWEQRYLKNLLTREDSIAATVMLLAPDRHYVQDGDVLVGRVPTSADEWSPYDVIVLGDVRAELFTPDQFDGLREHIADHGAGLLWIGGPSATPSSWFGAPTAGLLPMIAGEQGVNTWDQPVTIASTPEADRLGILQLSDPGDNSDLSERLRDPSTGWSQLRLVQRIERANLKPGTAVLAEALPIDGSADTTPAVLTMRYAAGRIGYIATDEIWRWRYGRGEALPERFWLPILRMLARGSVAHGSTPALLRITPTTPEPGSPVQITAELLDQSLIDTMPGMLEATITRTGGQNPATSVSLSGQGPLRLGSWIPAEPGHYQITLNDPALALIVGEVTVLESSDERRSLDTDHALLADLSAKTGGAVVDPADFGEIPAMLPNRARITALPPSRVPLWNRPLILLLLVLLVTTEWIARKALRLA